jgi:homospermidine synthase
VLLMGHGKGAYWYGSQLSIDQTRVLAPYNNATSLQVAASVLGAMVWAIENPEKGLVEADEIDHTRVLEIARPYLGIISGEYSKWTPLEGRTPADNPLFSQDVDLEDPWQFKNFRVS